MYIYRRGKQTIWGHGVINDGGKSMTWHVCTPMITPGHARCRQILIMIRAQRIVGTYIHTPTNRELYANGQFVIYQPYTTHSFLVCLGSRSGPR